MKNQFEENERDELVFGRNAVLEALKADTPINHILVTSMTGSLGAICNEAKKRGIIVKQVDSRKLDQMTGNANHQGVCAEGACVSYATVEDILAVSEQKGTAPFLILCDGIEDPHNLGAILRTAEACGADGVILPKRRSASLTQTVFKTSAGAASCTEKARILVFRCGYGRRGSFLLRPDRRSRHRDRIRGLRTECACEAAVRRHRLAADVRACQFAECIRCGRHSDV